MSSPADIACGVPPSKAITSESKTSEVNDNKSKNVDATLTQEDKKKFTWKTTFSDDEKQPIDGNVGSRRTGEQHVPDSKGGGDNSRRAGKPAAIDSKHHSIEASASSKFKTSSEQTSSLLEESTNSKMGSLIKDTDDQGHNGNDEGDHKLQNDTKPADTKKPIGESNTKQVERKSLNATISVTKPSPIDGGDVVKKKSANKRKRSQNEDDTPPAGSEETNDIQGRDPPLLSSSQSDLPTKQNVDDSTAHQVEDKILNPISKCDGTTITTDVGCSSVATKSQTKSGAMNHNSSREYKDDLVHCSDDVTGDSPASLLHSSTSRTISDDKHSTATQDESPPRKEDKNSVDEAATADQAHPKEAKASVIHGSSASQSPRHDRQKQDEAPHLDQPRQATAEGEANSATSISGRGQSPATPLHDDDSKAIAFPDQDDASVPEAHTVTEKIFAATSIDLHSPISDQKGTSTSIMKKTPRIKSKSTPLTPDPSRVTKKSSSEAAAALHLEGRADSKAAKYSGSIQQQPTFKKRAPTVTFAADLVTTSTEDKSTTTHDSRTTDDSTSSAVKKRKRRRKGSKKRSSRKTASGEKASALDILRASLAASSADAAEKNISMAEKDEVASATSKSASAQVPGSATQDALSPGGTLDNIWQKNAPHIPQRNGEKAKTMVNIDTTSSDRDGAPYRSIQCDQRTDTVAKESSRRDYGNTKPAATLTPTRLQDEQMQRPKSLIELASRTPEPTRSEHTRILLNLFAHVDAQRMDELGKECVQIIPELSATLKKGHSSEAVFCVSPPDSQTSVLATMPAALQRFRELSNQRREQHKKSILEDAKKRKGYASRSLQELEDLVSSKFFESPLFKENANLSRKMPQTATPQPPPNGSTAAHDTNMSFIPFALEYNEESIAAISSWLGKQEQGDKKGNRIDNVVSSSRPMPYDRPTVAPMFRKCSVCKRFGHYEIECNALKQDEILDFARRTRVQVTVRELVEKKMDPKAKCFRFYQAVKGSREERTMESVTKEGSPEIFTNMRLTCEVCQSALDDVHMLICDGCDKLFHLFCLDPPLKQVPDGDWFCKECQGHSEAVNSDVEIEACDGFVIEQRKRPRSDRHLREDEGIGFPSDGWQTAIAVIGNDVQVVNETVSESRRSKRRRQTVAPEEEVEIDGFKIVAKATSDSPHVSRRMKAWASSVEDISKDPLVVGSAVAWFPKSDSSDDNDASPDHVTSDPFVGIVLAVDSSSRRALVRQVVGWKDVLLDSWTEETSETPGRLEDCSIQALPSGATAWVSVENLHQVGRAPPEGVFKSFRQDILPTRLVKERQNRAVTASAPESAGAGVTTR